VGDLLQWGWGGRRLSTDKQIKYSIGVLNGKKSGLTEASLLGVLRSAAVDRDETESEQKRVHERG